MATPQWEVFAGAVLLTTAGLLVLTRASSRLLFEAEPGESPEATSTREPSAGGTPRGRDADAERPPPMPTGPALLLNLAFTHGLLALIVAGIAWYTGAPAGAFGIGAAPPAVLGAGVALGVGIYLASEATSTVAKRLGRPPDERLRAVLSPGTGREWALLLLVVLPAVATAEELLFRGALIGAMAAGFEISPWLLVVASSVLFGLGHVAQGRLGVLVTATLGLVLGAAFVATGSLVVVVLAHYTVDALEFLVHEWLFDDDESGVDHRNAP